MKTLQEHYNAIQNGKGGNKAQFLRQARQLFPQYINQYSDFDTATRVLKSKQVINEANAGGVVSKGFDIFDWKKILAEEAKAEEKKVSKEVEDANKNAFQPSDIKNADNINFNEIMKGFYAELKDEKNHDKTADEIKAMVVKNLAKDCLYYTKDGEFGTKGVGYTTEAPGLGEPKEPKGKYKSSGYGDLDTDKKVEKVKANVQDSLGEKEAKTSMPKKVKEMPVAAQNSSGVKKMATPGAEKRIKLKEGIQDVEEAHQMMNIGSVSGGEGGKRFVPKELPFSSQLRNENYDDEFLDAAFDIILKYTKDPDEAERELEAFNSRGFEGFSDALATNLERDEEWQAFMNPGIDPSSGLSSHMEEQKLRSIIRNIIKEELDEYGMDSGGQDMTWGMYNRSTSKKDQGNKDFIDKGYYDYYDDIPFNTPAYEFGKNKYYGGADLAKLWQLGWKKAEAEDKGIEFVEDEPNVEDWNDQTGDYDEANLNETK